MDKHLFIVEANTTGTGLLALQKAQELGFAPVFLTNDPSRYHGLDQMNISIVLCNTNSLEALQQVLTTALKTDQLLGVTTTSEFYLEAVAELAAAYHLPGNSPSAMSICRNKASTRLCLQDAGVKQPRFTIVRTRSDLNRALIKLVPPYIVKPADDTGSHNVRLCQDAQQAEAQALHILEIATNVRGQQTAQTVLIEEFLACPEFSVETFTWEGKVSCLGITEKTLAGFPYFVEQRHIFPAPLALDVAWEIQATVERALAAVGITHGAAHTEVKLTSQGCAIIEINARLAGGMIPELLRATLGVDVLEQQLKAAVGEPPCLHGNGSGYAGIHFLTSQQEGWLQDVQGLAEVQALKGIERVVITASPGAKVQSPQSAYSRLGYVIAHAESYELVARTLQQAIEILQVNVTKRQTRTTPSRTPYPSMR